MALIAPSILSANFARLAEELDRVQTADLIHVDVMDGHFVPNITLGPGVVKAVRASTSVPLDVHLMIESPERYLGEFADAGASYLTVHAEACTHLHRVLQSIRQLGVKAGVALNPASPLNLIEHVLDEVDMVLLMTVNPGFGGQRLIEAAVAKVPPLLQLLGPRRQSVLVEVDGGVTVENAPRLIQVGVDVLVAGSAVFSQSDCAGVISALRAGSRPRLA